MKERVFDLEERLIAFAVRIIRVAEALPKTAVGNHIRGQLRVCENISESASSAFFTRGKSRGYSHALGPATISSHTLSRSGTSPAPNYGEAQSAESRSDFVHKLKVGLKELRETRVWLLMVRRAELIKPVSTLDPLIQETDELISIFVKSAKTAATRK